MLNCWLLCFNTYSWCLWTFSGNL